MLRLMMLFAVCSLCACQHRPDAFVGVVNAPKKQIRGYNLRQDYDSNGNLKPGAKGETRPARSIDDVNKYVCTDPDGYEQILAAYQTLKEEYDSCQRDKEAQ